MACGTGINQGWISMVNPGSAELVSQVMKIQLCILVLHFIPFFALIFENSRQP